MEKLKYPIGRFEQPALFSTEHIKKGIEDISTFPQRLEQEVKNLSNEQLETRYRPEGWTIRQVVHHCADSHMNSIIRFKLALTEDNPIIKPYYEERWAELADSNKLDILPSLEILRGVHHRLTVILSSMSHEDLGRTFVHPEHNKETLLKENILIYAWHGNHHLAHITSLKERMGW